MTEIKPNKPKNQKVATAKNAGRDLQKEVAKAIGNLLNLPVGKDEEIASREGSQTGTDIRLSRRVLELFPFSIECKNEKKWQIKKAIEQAIQNQSPNTFWAVVFKKRGRTKDERINPVVMMDLKEFFILLSTWDCNKLKEK